MKRLLAFTATIGLMGVAHAFDDQAAAVAAAAAAADNARVLGAANVTGTAPPAARSAHAVQISASSDSKNASAKLVLGEPTARSSASVIVKVPLDEDNDRTRLWSPGGDTVSGTNVELRVQAWSLSGVRAPDDKATAACIAQLNAATPALAEQVHYCDLGLAKERLSEQQYLDLRKHFFGPYAAAVNYGGGISLNYKDFTHYTPLTFTKHDDTHRGAGINAFIAWQPLATRSLYSVKAELARTYKGAKSQVSCLNSTAPTLSCIEGAMSPPERKLARTLTTEYRTYLGDKKALAVQLKHDFASDISALSIPFYLVGDGKGLTGGVALTYSTEDDKPRIGVFVTQAFALRD